MSERVADAYRGVRTRTTDLVRDASAEDLEQIAPATPEWRVRDVLAHMVGVSADVVAGRIDGVATDPWTAAQVDARRTVSIVEMLDEWRETGPQFEAALTDLPDTIGGQAVADAITHEQDIRHALGRPGAREGDAIDVAFDFCCWARTQGGAPALRIVTERGETVAGAGEPVANVELSQFEFVRATTGRRSASEVAAYGWNGTVDPATVLVGPIFRMRTTELRE
jgi:uncharacterized protein (TIGR03083 family)